MSNRICYVAPGAYGLPIVLSVRAIAYRGKLVPGLVILNGRRFLSKTPVCGVPNVQKDKNRLADGERNAESENKAKTEVETNEPDTRVKKARPVMRFSHFHGGRK